MYALIIFLPLGASLLAGFGGRLLGWRGAALVSTGGVAVTALLSWVALYEVGLGGTQCALVLAPWCCTELFDATWGLYFDSLTVVMCVVITTVSTLVHVYSVSYMGEDPHVPRFMSYLSIFTFFMLMLVTADNFLQMFFGWEGVGLASYLLINFWFTRLQASKASIKAMLVNRVGDFGLALGIMALYSVARSLDFATVFALAPSLAGTTLTLCTVEVDALTCIALLLFVGAVGKSAQLGLHTWLPDAMEGPTPVSALIHAATMVTAGVFLIARCSPLFEYAPRALVVVACVGAATCFFAATTGLVQNDLKRVIAYSTASQLGYMVFACGLSHYAVGVFHLMNHAFFKALLFLGAGSVIHALADEQDMRKMGGVAQLLPFTYAMMLIGTLALVGFPFLTGFYSKDVILEVAYSKYTMAGTASYLFGALCVGFTSYYSFRLVFLTFVAPANSWRTTLSRVHDAPVLLGLPLVVLALGSLFVGYLARDMMIGMGTDFWGHSLYVLPAHSVLVESEFMPQAEKLLPLWATLGGLMLAYGVTMAWPRAVYRLKTTPLGRALYMFFNRRWYVDKVYNDWISGPALRFGYHTSFKALDKGCLELLGPAGIASTFGRLARYTSGLQTGLIYHYAVVMLLGLTVLISVASLGDLARGLVDARLYWVSLVAFVFYGATTARSV